MEQNLERERRRAEQRADDIRRLRALEQEAVHPGRKLGPRDRLRAAFHLTRAWKEANRQGLRKEEFQDAVFSRLQRQHGKRQEFRLTNWTLRRGEDPTTQDLTEIYEDRPTPQKSLEPYLVAVGVAAEHCEADPDEWKLDMVRDLSIWSRQNMGSGVAPPDDRPAETLAILINALCAKLGARNQLADTFDAIRRMSCRWDMFSERLMKTEQNSMDRIDSPISPVCRDDVYFEEMFPFPSIAVLRVPYTLGKAVYVLAPEAKLRPLDAQHLSTGDYFTVGLPFKLDSPLDRGRHYNIPERAPGLEIAPGEFVWFREIRLCIVPDGRGGFTSALETRPHLEVTFDQAHPFGGRHHVAHGYEIDLERGLYYRSADDGGPIFPNIQDSYGQAWRITVQCLPDSGFQILELTFRDPETTGWFFDPDPVLSPGVVSNEPWYLSYTSASSIYLRHWLTQGWPLAREWSQSRELATCPWNPNNLGVGQQDPSWNRNLPPLHELNFPDRSHATWLECCLHNGLIEEALQAKIDLLKEQTSGLQSEWLAAREYHSNALLRRWKAEGTGEES